MTEKRFKYRLDRRARIVTLSVLGVLAVVSSLLWLFSPGGYLSAWFSSISLAVVALAALSIPRSIRVTPDAVEISCTVEISHIPREHIKDVRHIERSELRPFVPLFASPGFFGYFGYWLDVREWDLVKVYASSWRGLVMIEDIYEQRYIVNADDRAALVTDILAISRSPRRTKRTVERRAKRHRIDTDTIAPHPQEEQGTLF